MRYFVILAVLMALVSCSENSKNTNAKIHDDLTGIEWQKLTAEQAVFSMSEDVEHFKKYLENRGENWNSLIANGKIYASIKSKDLRVSPLWEGTWVSYHTHLELSDTFPLLCGTAGIADMYHEWQYLSRHDAPGCFDDKGHVLNRCLYTMDDRYYVICK